jgi:elongation factor P
MNGAKVQDVHVAKKDLQFLYKDTDFAYFMNTDSYEQVQIALKTIPEHAYLKEGETFNISFLGQEPLFINFPPKMVFKVTETAPGIKGNSATNVFKEARLENGMTVKVPLFINTNDSIRVDTRTGAYHEKASS